MESTLSLADVLLLAIIQGVTEWLPISSSGHLVIAQSQLFILVGNVPTAFIGLAFRGMFKSFFSDLNVVGTAFIFTGLLLFASASRREKRRLGYLNSLLVGAAQGFALIPGISRSGATIAVGLLLGLEREVAFKYSFLLSVPAIIGATVEESLALESFGVDIPLMFLGVLFTVLVGYASLKALSRIVKKGKLHFFAPYCLIRSRDL